MASDERFEPEKQKQGMSTGTKVVIILLCIGGGLVALCCGAGIYIVSSLKGSASEDPAVVAEVTKQIAEIDIPKTYQPKMSINADFWFSPVKLRMAAYEGPAKSTLMLMEVANKTADEDESKQFKQQMQQQGQGGRVRDLDIKESKVREFTIRGRKVPFHFRKGVDRKTNVACREVSGTFDGKDKASVVVFMLQTPEANYDEKAVVKMIESIR